MNVQKYNALRARDQQFSITQVAPTTASAEKRMQGAGKITSITAYYSVRPAAGESMAVDVLKNGVSVQTGALSIASTSPVGPAVATMALDATLVDFVDGDLFKIVLTYVAGGGPAPMTIQDVRVVTTPG